MIATVFIFAQLGDKLGHKINHVIAGIIKIIGFCVVMWAQTLWAFIAGFLVLSLYEVALAVSNTAMVMEFGNELDRPTYISIRNTITAPFSFVAPIIGAAIAKNINYTALFIIGISINILYTVFMIVFVREPRKEQI